MGCKCLVQSFAISQPNRNVRPDITISFKVGPLALVRRLSFLLSVPGNNGECADTNREMVGGIYEWAGVAGGG